MEKLVSVLKLDWTFTIATDAHTRTRDKREAFRGGLYLRYVQL
jgi:hypothetical protein